MDTNQPNHPEVFFHLGLGKVASTYLQYAFFPKLKGIYYIQRTRYRNTKSIVDKNQGKRFFVSREMDQQLEAEVKLFAEQFPNTKAILLLRRHDDWIASQYRRHIKNGSPIPFEEFIDIDQDKGWWPKSELYFYPKIKIIERYFNSKPLVLFYEDLKKDPYQFMDKIAAFLGASYERENVSLASIHTSYNETQLKIMRNAAGVLFKKEPNWSKNRLLLWFQRRGRLLLCYLILYPAKLIPKSWVSKEPLIPIEERARIKEAFKEDWESCKNYASSNNFAKASKD